MNILEDLTSPYGFLPSRLKYWYDMHLGKQIILRHDRRIKRIVL